MEKNNGTTTYIKIMGESLEKKNALLTELLEITKHQEQLISEEKLDLDEMEKTLQEKDRRIRKLNLLDEGFEGVYSHMKEELQANPGRYKEELQMLQNWIIKITDQSVELQAMEKRNKNRLEFHFSNTKKEIKNFQVSNQTVAKYYKNMSNRFQGQSYFLDKKN